MANVTVDAQKQTKAVHPVDEVLPLGQLLVYGFQHVLVMYAGAVAVPLLVGAALRLSQEQIVYLINADLFTSGIATLIQVLGLGKLPIGSKMPIIQGCTFTAVTPMILIGNTHDLTTIYGSVIVSGLIVFLISPYFSRITRFFPPVVTGTIITTIGLTLLPAAIGWAGGGQALSDPAFGNIGIVLFSFAVLVFILLIYRFFRGFISNIAVLLGIVIGTLVAIPLGLTNFAEVTRADWFGITTPFRYGLPTFDLASIAAMTLVMLVTMAETTGDMIAVGDIVGKRVSRRVLASGLRADGLSTMIGGVLNSFPYTAFAENVGLVSLTNVKSRFVVATTGVMLLVLGLFPKLGAVVAAIPAPVLGGAGIVLFGTVAAVGIKSLAKVDFSNHANVMIVAVSLGVGMIPVGAPTFYHQLPDWLQIITNSGITAGCVAAIVLNIYFHGFKGGGHKDEIMEHEEHELQPVLATEGPRLDEFASEAPAPKREEKGIPDKED
uniref:Uracil permease n=1 Tax=Thermosporothrix sp. COM3 TaxID=2490863 RepID=A0A455SG15_9CHLR|nr:uracil permease [Thermosporothrix sp. COM3]